MGEIPLGPASLAATWQNSKDNLPQTRQKARKDTRGVCLLTSAWTLGHTHTCIHTHKYASPFTQTCRTHTKNKFKIFGRYLERERERVNTKQNKSLCLVVGLQLQPLLGACAWFLVTSRLTSVQSTLHLPPFSPLPRACVPSGSRLSHSAARNLQAHWSRLHLTLATQNTAGLLRNRLGRKNRLIASLLGGRCVWWGRPPPLAQDTELGLTGGA